MKKLIQKPWSGLRRFGTNRVIKTSYFWLAIVPIAAKFLLQLKQPFVFTLLGKEHTVWLDLPFSWYAFYFSAVAFAIGTALFDFFCPRMIKQYSSFGDFFRESSGARELLNHFWDLDKETRSDILPSLYQEAAIALGDRPEHPGDPTEFAILVQTMIRRVPREEMTDLFTTLREGQDHTRPRVRTTITICYFFGSLLFVVVFGQNVASVIHAWLR